MARSLASITKRSAFFLGMSGLAACSSTTSAEDIGRTSAALSATNNDPTTQAFMVYLPEDSLHVPFEIFISKSRVYQLTCDNDADLTRLKNAIGVVPPNVASPSSLRDPSLGLGGLLKKDPGTVTVADFMPLPCKPRALEHLYYTDEASGTGVDGGTDGAVDGGADGGAPAGRKYFVRLQDGDHAEHDDNGNTILHNVGCGELLDAMGFDESGFPVFQRDATRIDPSLFDLFVRDDASDINCKNRTSPNDYVPRLSVQSGGPLAQPVNRSGAISPVQFRVDNVRPEAAVALASTSNDCGFLTVNGLTVQGTVPADFPRVRCSGSYFAEGQGQGPSFQTGTLTISLQMGCRDGTADCDKSGNCTTQLDTMTNCGSCNDQCASPANMSASCSNRVCQATCLAGFDDCNHVAADGCETPLKTLTDCRSCGDACPVVPNGTSQCTSGGCQLKCDDKYEYSNGACLPINQCAISSGLCAKGATCAPQGTGHSCTCPPGEIGDPNDPSGSCRCGAGTLEMSGSCVDACTVNNGGCDNRAQCSHNPDNSVSCACTWPFTGPGNACVPIGDDDSSLWAGWDRMGGQATSAPAISSWSPGRLDLFYRGTDNTLRHRWSWSATDPFSGEENLGGNLSSDPAAVSWGPGRIDVFARWADNTLVHQWYPNDQGAWSGWESLHGNLASAPSVASWGDGRLDVFYKGGDGHLKHKWFPGDWYNIEEDRGGAIADKPAAVSWTQGRIDIFARGVGNDLVHTWYEQDWGGWGGWESLHGQLGSEPGVASWAPGRLDIFYLGTDQSMRHKSYPGDWYNVEEPIGGSFTSSPSAVSWGPNRIDIFARDRDGQSVQRMVFAEPPPLVASWQLVSPGSGRPIPANAYVGGAEPGRQFYVCRGHDRGGVHPGKVVGGNCDFSLGGVENFVGIYDVLTIAPGNNHPQPHWLDVTGPPPANAFIGGWEPGRVLNVCRAAFGGGLHPGKVVDGQCSFGWGFTEHMASTYQVLTLDGSP